MNRLFFRCCIPTFIGITLLFPTHWLFAWGDEGHKIVGMIAYSRLAPTVKRKVDALLAADQDELTAPDFVSRTTWADKYRDSDRNGERIRYEGTRRWHFVDIEIANGNIASACTDYPKLPPGTAASAGPPNDCLIDKINQFLTELRHPTVVRPEKILALKFVLHLVGDLHQPLHTADNQDRGGNDVPVLLHDPATTENLHSYWDNDLVRRLGGSATLAAASLNKRITKMQVQRWSKGTPTDWAKESFLQAENVAYNFTNVKRFTDDHGARGIIVNAAYDDRALPAMRAQLAKAGVRLAAVLNQIIR